MASMSAKSQERHSTHSETTLSHKAASALGQTATRLAGDQMSGEHPEPDPRWPRWFVAYVPGVDLAV
jgi:hypothetical protein